MRLENKANENYTSIYYDISKYAQIYTNEPMRNKNNENAFSVMSSLQTNCCLKLNLKKWTNKQVASG